MQRTVCCKLLILPTVSVSTKYIKRTPGGYGCPSIPTVLADGIVDVGENFDARQSRPPHQGVPGNFYLFSDPTYGIHIQRMYNVGKGLVFL